MTLEVHETNHNQPDGELERGFARVFDAFGLSSNRLWRRHLCAAKPGVTVYVRLHGPLAGQWTLFRGGEVMRGAGPEWLAMHLAGIF